MAEERKEQPLRMREVRGKDYGTTVIGARGTNGKHRVKARERLGQRTSRCSTASKMGAEPILTSLPTKKLMTRVLALLLLCASLAAHADCGTDDGKMNAVEDFIDAHYDWGFMMVSPPDETGLVEVEFWLYDDEWEEACTGTVRVSDGCAVSDAEIECS